MLMDGESRTYHDEEERAKAEFGGEEAAKHGAVLCVVCVGESIRGRVVRFDKIFKGRNNDTDRMLSEPPSVRTPVPDEEPHGGGALHPPDVALEVF